MKNFDRVVVIALYRFADFHDFRDFREPLYDVMFANEVRGTLLLANEGINGTIAGPRFGIDKVIEWLALDARFSSLEKKESYAELNPFYRTKVKVKKEIVTMGVNDIDPRHISGTYVEPKDWNELIDDPEVLLLDTRNQYEIEIGSFQRATNPETESFREFPDYVSKKLDPNKHKKIAMFCTGGIRCEKSTAYLKQQGFQEVYHLRGGILQYLEDVPEAESKWKGECFVFDNRVTVNHQLEQGNYDQCHACRMPITESDKQKKEYRSGVSCHYCFAKSSTEQLERFAEREHQVRIAESRGESHIGQAMEGVIISRRSKKIEFKNQQRGYLKKKRKG
jgi:UPF0176 protein